jgi:hypothetical protein
MIQFTSIKWNAVNLGDQYYIAEYSVRLSFQDGNYQFEPTTIRLKLNSKYDMGWEEFDLMDGAAYFKKGKVMKKYKSYLSDMTARLNELNLHLIEHLSSD